MKNVSDKSCTENQNTHFVFSNFFFFPKIVLFYEVTWENVVERGAGHILYNRHTRIACWITKATKNTHSEYLLLIAFPRQGCFRERVWTSLYKYTGCLAVWLSGCLAVCHAVEQL